jgi:hypothetical protein
MTDLEKLIETYKQFGIDLEPIDNNGIICIKFGCHDNDKFGGYYDHYTIVEFTKEGKFIRQSFWGD